MSEHGFLFRAMKSRMEKDPEEREEKDEEEVPPELKLAAYEVMDAFGVGFGGDGERAEKAARALKAFCDLCCSMPSEEGEHEESEKF